MKSKMIKKILFLMLFIIGCSINNSDSEWTQYQKLEYKVADDYLGYQFDYEDLTIRLELPAFYVLNYSNGSQRNIGGRPSIIAYESKYANYDFLFSSIDNEVDLIWDGKLLVDSDTSTISWSNGTYVDKTVEDYDIIKKELEESIKVLEDRVASISLIVSNLDGDNKSWMYETKARKPIYNENGLIFDIQNTVLNKYIFLNNDLDNVDFALEVTLDGNKETVFLKSIPKEKMNSFKSYINDQNLKYSRNAELHSLD
jgi:hypothetical protein